MEKEIRRILYLLAAFILCVIWLTAHYTGRYYEDKYKTERDTYAYMYYKEIGNEEMAKTFKKSNIFERKNE